MAEFPQLFDEEKRMTPALRFALTYIAFLLVCLTLGLFLILFTNSNARHNYWAHFGAQLSVDVSRTDNDLDAIKNYAQQLVTDSTFVRMASMTGLEDEDFVYTAYQVMHNLNLRQYGLAWLPVKAHIYLPNSDYVISSSQFTTLEHFYKYTLLFPEARMDEWLSELLVHARARTAFDLVPYGAAHHDKLLAYDVSTVAGYNVPAVVWYELDTDALRNRFISMDEKGAVLLITNKDGVLQMALTQDGNPADGVLLSGMAGASYDHEGMGYYEDMKLIRRVGENGWIYTLALPHAMCTAELGDYTVPYTILFILAVLLGAALVVVLVRGNMRPIHKLAGELTRAQDDNAQMQRRIEEQRPLLCASYVRVLLSGHVASNAEFTYMMDFLGLSGDCKYFVLFCNAYQQSGVPHDVNAALEFTISRLEHHLRSAYPVYHYATLGRELVVLVTYPASADNAMDELRERVMALHDELIADFGLWFYAGAGMPCTQPNQLWESYEQARTAARYTAKNYIFLPYASIRKDADSWYYPIEMSAKLLHFITTGNRAQVAEMFSLIHRENVEERSLPMPLLALLLSDLKNTLLKARFQIKQPKTEMEGVLIRQMDERLNRASTFAELEQNALKLCEFFIRSVEPSDPIPEIQRYLQANFADPSLCLSKLSGLFNISESYLSHLFKDRTGENFSAYLENLRMEEAQRRLTSGDCTLSTLYQQLGYANATTFRRVFKKRFNMTPSEMMKTQ